MNSPISAEIADTKSDERFEEALHKLRQMGSRFDLEVLEATRKLFVPIIADQPWMSRKATRDIPYADDARRLLDIYPADQSKAPLVLFVHGGGFVAGAKDVAPPFNCNVGAYFAHHGYCAVLMNYRLAPQCLGPGRRKTLLA